LDDPNDKVVVMATMEGLRLGPLFDSLYKNVLETLSTLQSKVDKYITEEELAEAKCRRRGRNDHKRKEPDTRQSDHRAEVFMEIKNEDFVKWPGKIKTNPLKRNKNKFGGSSTDPLGWIKLPLILRMEPHQTIVWQDFIVVDCPSPYNAIIGQPTLGKIKAITSTYHLMMKFFTSTGIGDVRGDQKIDDVKIEVLRDEVEKITLVYPKETENTKPLEEVAPIFIHPDYLDHHVMIGTELTKELQNALVEFLKKNYDVFAWSHGDVLGIDPQISIHKLFTDSDYPLVCQKRRKFAPEL
ncbi:Sensory neuron membrane protein, partial [Actinidia chinensis var. chinensis]